MAVCPECGSSNTEKTSDSVYSMGGSSFYCRECDDYFNIDGYNDERESYLGSPTSLHRRAWESEEEYRERMEDLGIDPD